MSKNLSDMHAQVIEYVKQGKFAEGIEEFYAEDATAQENTNAPTVGRATMLENERAFLTKVTAEFWRGFAIALLRAKKSAIRVEDCSLSRNGMDQ